MPNVYEIQVSLEATDDQKVVGTVDFPAMILKHARATLKLGKCLRAYRKSKHTQTSRRKAEASVRHLAPMKFQCTVWEDYDDGLEVPAYLLLEQIPADEEMEGFL